MINRFFIFVFCFRQSPLYSTELNSTYETKSCCSRATVESQLSTAVARRLKQAQIMSDESKEWSLNHLLEYVTMCKVPWQSVFEKLIISGCPKTACCCLRVQNLLFFFTDYMLLVFLLHLFMIIFILSGLPFFSVRDPFQCSVSESVTLFTFLYQ